VSEWLLNAKWTICQLYQGENTLYFNTCLVGFFSLSPWYSSLWGDNPIHSTHYTELEPNEQFVSYIMNRTGYISMMSALYLIYMLSWIFIVLALSLIQQYVGRHAAPLYTLSWVRANQSFLLLFNVVCLTEEQQITIT
jgi:hypothetical protein